MNNIKSAFTLPVLVVALGYFVDIFDLTLFNMLRIPSLTFLKIPKEDLISEGILLLNAQMGGMLIGGLIWGMIGDKKGRLTVLFGSIFLYSVANILNAFVQNVDQYFFLRFVAGIGLAGELGAGITLITETLPKSLRGLGTTLVAAIGVLGATFGGLAVEFFSWKECYLIGGSLGLLLLFLRFNVMESELYNKVKLNVPAHSHSGFGNPLALFSNSERFLKFTSCVLIGVPIWYVAGIVMNFSPELGEQLKVSEPLLSSRTIGISYLGLAFGDFISGWLSQILSSRKKSMMVFMISTVIFLSLLFTTTAERSANYYYFICFLIGFGAGFWAIFVTIAAEQFGTNIRALVATSVPNFVRGATIPMTLMFKALKVHYDIRTSMILIGLLVFFFSFLSLWKLPESFHKDLNYLE